MIRGENAVTDIANLCSKSDGGLLTTLNDDNAKGSVKRRKTDGSFTSVDIPDWIAKQRATDKQSLWWLCVKLQYQFTFNWAANVRFSKLLRNAECHY